MRNLKDIILERLILSKNRKQTAHTLFPKTKDELKEMIILEIEKNGNECSLNHIDVSQIKDLSNLFKDIEKLDCERTNDIYLDVSNWDVSEVEDMMSLFEGTYSIRVKGISDWDVSNVKCMCGTFQCSNMNEDISNWDVSNVDDMSFMFSESDFNGDISKWNVSKVLDMSSMFENSLFNGDISNWDVSNVKDVHKMFYNATFDGNIDNWKLPNDCRNVREMFPKTALEDNPPKWYKWYK